MNNEHIVRSYDSDLNHLNDLIARMGGLAEKQPADAVQPVFKRDADEEVYEMYTSLFRELLT